MNVVLSNSLLLTGAVWPLLIACLFGFRATGSLALRLAPWAALPALAASLLATPGELRLHLSWMLLGSDFGLDATGQLFLLFTALLWTVAGVFSRGYLSQSNRRARFYVAFLLAMAGNFGLVVAHDLLSFYLGFAVMSFASYGLVVFERSPAALRAGRVYIALVVAGELMLFVAFIAAVQITGSTSFDAVRAGLVGADNRNLVILLALGGFGIKAGLLGLHVWLPLAHPVAPTPASAVLSGAMIKAGLLGWLRLLPLGGIALPGWGTTFVILGFATAFYGAGVGLCQRDPKTVLAYSSVSQMGVMTSAIGLGMLAPHAWAMILPVVVFYALHHGLSKGGLFLGMGLADDRYRMRGWVWVAMLLPALALAGAPWTSGMVAKVLLKAQFLEAPAPWTSWLPSLLTVSSLATALLMARLLYLVRPDPGTAATPLARELVRPWLVLLITILLLPWWVAPQIPSLAGKNFVESFWPLLLTAVIVAIVLRRGWFKGAPSIPAGDLLTPVERSLIGTHLAMRRLVVGLRRSSVQGSYRARFACMVGAAEAILRLAEKSLTRWHVAGLIIVLLMLVAGLMASVSFSPLD